MRLTPLRIALAIAVVIGGFFLWRYWRENQKPRQLFECQAFAKGDPSELQNCLKFRYGWDDREATDAFIKSMDDWLKVRESRR